MDGVQRGGLAAVMLAVAAAVLMVACNRAARAQPTPATASASSTPIAPVASPTNAPTASVGASFAYARPDGTIWLMHTDGTERELVATPLVASAAEASSRVAWSPDGRSLAYRSADNRLILLDADAGKETVLDGQDIPESYPPMWSRPGEVAYLKRAAEHVFDLWLASPGAAPRRIAADVLAASWSPDGARIALSRRLADVSGRGFALSILDAASGAEREIAYGGQFLGWSPDSRLVAYWREPGGGSAIIGDVYAQGVTTGLEIKLGTFSSDEEPQWAPDASAPTFMNVGIDPATGARHELWPRVGVAPFVQPSALIGWSPDLRHVVLVRDSAAGRDLIVRDIASGNETLIHHSVAVVPHAASPGYRGDWSPDGRYFAFLSADAPDLRDPHSYVTNAYIADTKTGTTRKIEGTYATLISYAPGGDALMLTAGANVDEIWISEADGSDPRHVATGMPIIGGRGSSPWRRHGS
jgi:Tol biopolymer transport system component